MAPDPTPSDRQWPQWHFHLTEQERFLALGILTIFLIGLIARHIHLRSQTPDPAPVHAPWSP